MSAIGTRRARFWRTIALLVSLAACCSAAGAQREAATIDAADLPPHARRALFRARGFLEQGEPERALEVLEAYVREGGDPALPAVRSYRAAALAETGRSQEALEQYELLAEATPTDAQVRLRVGELSYELNRYLAAGEAFLEAHRLLGEASAACVLHYAAVAFLLADQADRGLPLLEELTAGRHGPPEFEWFQSLTAAHLERADAAAAEPVVARMLAQFPADARAWRLASQQAAAQGDYRKAAATLTVADYLSPLDRRERVLLADLWFAIGVPAEAAANYERAFAQDGSADEYERLASAYLAAHLPEAAAALLERVIARAPAGRLWELLGEIRYSQGRYRAARDALTQAIALGRGEPRTLRMMEYCERELGLAP
jgi:tetratricopeptide (TPR) repeat protein